MPNPARNGSDKLVALIAEIEAEAYARGKADAKKELLDVLGSGEVRAPRAKTSRGRKAKTAVAPKRRASGRKRAPRGSVRRFVEQALRDRPGVTLPEIFERAAGAEQPVKQPSIRTELGNGRRQGRYESHDGRWFLAGHATVGAGTREAASTDTASAFEAEPTVGTETGSSSC